MKYNSSLLEITDAIFANAISFYRNFIGIKEININNENASKPEQKTTIILPIQDK